jgi:DNA polymerase-1
MSLHDEVRATIWGYPDKYTPQELANQLWKFRLTPETRYDEKGKDLLVAEQKMRAKNVNFGTVYGITSAGLAEQCDCTSAEAQIMLDAWFRKFPGCAKFIEQCKMAPFEGKTLITAFGRKKRPGVVSQELAVGISNEFANFPEQSTASDITLQSGIVLNPILQRDYDSYICNLIHDALLIDCPDDDDTCNAVARLTIDVMQQVPKDWGFNLVPFIAEAKQGHRWGSLSEMHFKEAA